MGIAKFFAYISERYPALNEKIKENQIPEFDNLYLDMNGIIHTCTHPKDKDITFLMSEEEMFKTIFRYIEGLFLMIKPKKLFFMAVDGVAPRAKINQQRGRRFCTARTSEMLEAMAAAQGEPIPEDKKFDSNCITPGTVFMDKLNKYLKYLVTHNISTNKLWQRCKVIFSGSEVAGEGEHKIMDYIRYMKSQPDYNINTRHCLYGLDADLIMLGLCTHELHFALLREEIVFGKKQRVTLDPGQTQFYLFHISLMRDYIDHEFAALKHELPFAYDLDKIIDDWILIAFLIGNDFIPHAPNIYILTDGIPILYDVYREMLSTFDGYINEGGTLNLERFEKFMEKLSHLDIRRFSETYSDLKFLEGKRAAAENNSEKSGKSESEKTRNAVNTNDEMSVKKPRSKELEALIKSTMMLALGDSNDGDAEDSEETNTEQYMMEFAQHKKDYYVSKLNYDSTDKEFLQTLTEDYIRAIQWNLYYYYEGCQSWTWYYPHHYAPYISDITNFKHLKLEFEMGEPFRPFEQLLAVLPPYSRRLLPPAFQDLLVEDESPIISYYPVRFETDLNGKRNEWEAVVLIPFINGDKLRDAMVPHYGKLTADENARNKHGPMCIFTHTTENLGIYKAPAYFPDVVNHAQLVLIDRKDIVVPKDKLVKGLSRGVKRDVLYLGFASLCHMEHTAVFKRAEVKVFNMPSRWINMILQIPEKDVPDLKTLADELMGKPVYVNWPYLRRAKVVGVSDENLRVYSQEQDFAAESMETFPDPQRDKGVKWRSMAKLTTDTYKQTRGIEIGETKVLIRACLSSGKRYMFNKEKGHWHCEEQWYETELSFPYQLLVRDLKYLVDEEDEPPKKVADIFLPGTICFSLGTDHYGAMGEVLEDKSNERWKRDDKIRLCLTVPPKLSLKKLQDSDPESKQKYMTGKAAAMLLGVSSIFFARITGTIYVTEMSGGPEPRLIRHNIGLNLKFNKKNEEIPGYTRRIKAIWFYSNKVVNLVRNYMKKYPELFERLWKFSWNDEFYLIPSEELFNNTMPLSEVTAWLHENYPTAEKRTCGAKVLSPDVVQEIEKELDAYAEKEVTETKRIRAYANPSDLFVPSLHMCATLPDSSAEPRLFDRVIHIREDSAVPLGYQGVIVAILKDKTALETIYEIVFDKPFPGGLAINGCSNYRGYRLPGSAFIDISNEDRMVGDKFASRDSRQLDCDRSGTWRQSRTQKPQIHSDQSAFASVSVKNVRLAPQTSLAPPQLVRNLKNGNRDAEKDPVENSAAQPKNSKPASEFQALWNELHEKQKSNKNRKTIPLLPPQKPKQPGKPFPQQQGTDPTALLRAMLKINDLSTGRNKSGPGATPKGIPYLPPPANASMNNREPSLNSSSSTDDKAMDAPPLVKQMFHHARQTKESQQNKDGKPPLWWYCSQLLNYYQLSRLGMPRYNYFVDGETNMIRAHIVLPDNRMFVGDPSVTHELAAGSAAKKVYREVMQPDLKNLVPPPHQWFANQQNPPRGPPLRPPMMPNFHTNPVPGPPPRFQHWHGKPPPNPSFPQLHIQPRPQHRPSLEEVAKPEVKNSTAFVPLQAQKKNRKLSAGQTSKESKSSHQPAKEAQNSKKELPSKSSKADSGQEEETGRESSAQSNSQTARSGQNNQKAGQPKRSRVAAKFGGASAPQPAEPGSA